MSAMHESKNKHTLKFRNWEAFIRRKLNGEGLGKHVFDGEWNNANILRIDENNKPLLNSNGEVLQPSINNIANDAKALLMIQESTGYDYTQYIHGLEDTFKLNTIRSCTWAFEAYILIKQWDLNVIYLRSLRRR